jgi:uncharacterized membrane protein YfcA
VTELGAITPEIAIPALLVVLCSSAVQSATGFGFSVVALPFLVVLLGVRDGVVVNLVLSMVANAAVTLHVHQDAVGSIVRPMLVGGVVGLVPGIVLFYSLDLHVLQAGIAVIVTLVALMLLFRVHWRTKERRSLSAVTGVFSGLLGGVAGLAGPPLTVYFASLDLGKVRHRATMSVYFTLLNFVLVPAHVLTARSGRAVIWSLVLLPAVPLGGWAGRWAFGRVDEVAFQRIVALVVLAAGLSGVVAAAQG